MLGTVKVPGKLCKVAVVTVGWRSRRVVNRSFSAATAMAVRTCCSSQRSSTAFIRANSWRSLLLIHMQKAAFAFFELDPPMPPHGLPPRGTGSCPSYL